MTLTSDAKFIIGILIATVLVIGGGVYITSKKTPSSAAITVPDSLREHLVREDSASLGPSDAKVTVVEFGDFQCPACAALHPALKEVKKQYTDKSVRFVFRQFPLSQHQHAFGAAVASLAAKNQGKFWEYHDTLFEHQANLSSDDLRAYAQQLGLNMDQFMKDIENEETTKAVQRDVVDGNAVGVSSTPTVFINNTQYTGQYSLQAISAAIDAELAK